MSSIVVPAWAWALLAVVVVVAVVTDLVAHRGDHPAPAALHPVGLGSVGEAVREPVDDLPDRERLQRDRGGVLQWRHVALDRELRRDSVRQLRTA